jgi:K+-sensing histidine kinase KdpD
MTDSSSPKARGETIQWDNFVKFVRQLSHDLRNQLNAAELQGALIGELTTDPELKGEVLRLRELVSQLGGTLQRLSNAVASPRPTCLAYAAEDLVGDLQKTIARDFPEHSQRVTWDVSLNGAILNIDPGLISWVATELFDNAFRHNGSGKIAAQARAEKERFVFQLHEPKSEAVDPAGWNELLGAVKHGHYGFGLHRARAIALAHGGELTSEWDMPSSTLTSRMILPCSAPSSAENGGSFTSTNSN